MWDSPDPQKVENDVLGGFDSNTLIKRSKLCIISEAHSHDEEVSNDTLEPNENSSVSKVLEGSYKMTIKVTTDGVDI